jgi:hypothetical protein
LDKKPSTWAGWLAEFKETNSKSLIRWQLSRTLLLPASPLPFELLRGKTVLSITIVNMRCSQDVIWLQENTKKVNSIECSGDGNAG